MKTPTKAKKPAAAVKLVVSLTAGQSELIASLAKRLRCTPEQYLVAATMSEVEGWSSFSELMECTMDALRMYVDEGAAPECPR